MALKRTNVYADEADLALIKAASARQGVSEAEIIREGIHRMALATRVWDEPFLDDDDVFDFGGPVTAEDIAPIVARAADDDRAR
ncbi:CopG family transcriptional regulator [Streptomyces sp. NPDC046887]|uniref:ribbon-helix-helix domain-containing protein n=1 Tax=Streptomyces sp. NPDC046887 TaxID=3155472 RepID=UPI0033CBAB87